MIRVRSRHWVVSDRFACSLPMERLRSGLEKPQHLITLSSVENGLGGKHWTSPDIPAYIEPREIDVGEAEDQRELNQS
jgi:hypothetical protein